MNDKVSTAREEIKHRWIGYLEHQLKINEIDNYVYNKFMDKGLELLDEMYAAGQQSEKSVE